MLAHCAVSLTTCYAHPACAVGAVVLADVFLVNAITSGLVVTLCDGTEF